MPDHLWRHILVQLILLSLTAFFSVIASALSSCSVSKLEDEAAGGDINAKKVLRLTEKIKCIYTVEYLPLFFCFVGAAFTNGTTHSIKYITYLVMRGLRIHVVHHTLIHTIVLIVLMLILALLYFTFGFVIPRRIGSKNPEKKVKSLRGVILFTSFFMSPFIGFVKLISAAFLRPMGIKTGPYDEAVTEEEILQMVDAGEEIGSIETNEKQMIENIFEFNNTTAADIMIHRMEMTAIDVEDDGDKILSVISETGYSRFPVYESDIDNIIGILGTRVFLMNRCSGNKKKLRELLYEPYFVPEAVSADALLAGMQQKKSHMAVVLDEHGGTSGLVTMEDLLEEIVGNIYDENDEPADETEIRHIGENTWRIDGTAPLSSVEEIIGIDFPPEDDDLTTMSGLIFSRFETIPADGETPELDIGQLHIKVEGITDHRVDTALVMLIPKENEIVE